MTLALRLALVMALLCGICSVACAGEYVDSSGTYHLDIPDGWNTQDSSDGLSLVASNKISQVNISIQDSGRVTLDEFAQVFPKQMKKELDEFNLLYYGKTVVDGAPAGVWVYTAEVDGIKIKFRNIIIFPQDSEVMYNAVFATIPDLYNGDVGSFDAMMESWRWSRD